MRSRRITKYGGSYVIKLIPEDLKDLDLKIGDIVDIDEIVKLKQEDENA